ncbi:MAG: LysM peptidoglycan-binding domain-containing protein [Candidatus Adiutrix sp.]
MTRTHIMLLFALTTGAMLMASACLNSEAEYKRLVEEKNSLAAELILARQENELLLKAQKNIFEKREAVQTLLSTQAFLALDGATPVNPLTGAGEPSSPPMASGNLYRAQAGDTLSTIAARHNTSTDTLLRLNPQVARRNSQMVWVDDQIVLP